MFIRAFDFKIWADKRTLRAVEKIDKNKYQDSYFFTLQQINHIVIVEALFQSRLTNNPAPYESTNTDNIPGFDELEKRLFELGDWYLKYVSTYTDGDKPISFKFADGKQGKMTVEEMLFHILTHGSYHRGNIAHALDLASVPHPIDGYGVYIHEKEPQRRET